MKRSILFMILVSLFSSGVARAGNDTPIVISPDPSPPPGPGPCRLIFIPISTTINDMELAIYFELSIGYATITVTDDTNQVVYQEAVDTDSSSELQIPVDQWTNGNYKLSITYGAMTIVGEFEK
jgi:hypothetical protein